MRARHPGIRLRAGVVAAAALLGASTLLAAPAGAAGPSGSADVALAFTVSPASTQANNRVTYTATVTNAGPDPASKVELVDGTNAIGAVTSQPVTTLGSCGDALELSVVDCHLGTLAAGASASVTITIQLYSPGVIANTAGVTAATPDPDSTNNTATATEIVTAQVPYGQTVVDGYFKGLFHRLPTDAELTAWMQRFDRSDFASFVRDLTATTTYRTAWLDRQFQTYLGRSLGATGGFYLGWLRSGRSYDDVVASIVSSNEFTTHLVPPCHPGGPCVLLVRDAWVRAAYHDITGDEISDALVASYQARLDAGASHFAVAKAIVTSAEGRRKFVDGITRLYLHRGATNYELYLNISELLKGQRPEVTEASMLASYEFLKVFVPTQAPCCTVTTLPGDR